MFSDYLEWLEAKVASINKQIEVKMTVIEKYKKWKIKNPDKEYQYDEIGEFIAELSRSELQSFFEMVEKLTSHHEKIKKH